MAQQDPIWAFLERRGHTMAWFARDVMHFSYVYVKGVKYGRYPVSAEFRRRASEGLNMPESALFLSAREEVPA